MASAQSSKSLGLDHAQANVALMMIVKKCRSAAMSQDVVKPAKNHLSQVCVINDYDLSLIIQCTYIFVVLLIQNVNEIIVPSPLTVLFFSDMPVDLKCLLKHAVSFFRYLSGEGTTLCKIFP